MNILSQAAVVVLIMLVGLAFLLISRRSDSLTTTMPQHQNQKQPGSFRRGGKQSTPPSVPTPGVTLMPPVLYVEQLHPDTNKVIERFEIHDIPVMGVTISRPDAQRGTIKLNPAVRAAYTVSENHVRIGRDAQGMFVQDQKNDGRMRLPRTRAVVEEIDIKDGLILQLGMQPLRFLIPDPWGSVGGTNQTRFAANTRTNAAQTRQFGGRP